MKKISFSELASAMIKFNQENGYTTKGNPKKLKGVIVFSKDSFNKPYTEQQRSYEVTSDEKAFLPNMLGTSLFGDCLDGIDISIRLDWYMGGREGWKVDYCYLLDNQN